MARIRTVDFLPEIFKTDTNSEFLGATLDQLVQEPELKKVQGYVGRRFGPGTRYNDSYVLEDTSIRDTYQLEPGVAFTNNDGQVTDAITYPGLIDSLKQQGAIVNRHDRLFENETYSWHPHIDFDKFINYTQYYWLPDGPDSVDVSANAIAFTDDFLVSNTVENKFTINDINGTNPMLTLVRGGSYTFEVDQDSPFWIQAEAGVDGTFNHAPNIETRSVYGVSNNGATQGTITFNVPTANAQDYYHNLADAGVVDLATRLRYEQINNRLLSQVNDIDGIIDLDNKTIVFLDQTPGDSFDLGWYGTDMFAQGSYDQGDYDKTIYLDTPEERLSVYRIKLIESDDEVFVTLIPVNTIALDHKFKITSGAEYSNRFFHRRNNEFKEVPLLTAANDYLYYQDGTTANKFGIIKLVDQESSVSINVNDIIGSPNYISPNGVTFTNGLKVRFDGNIEPAHYVDNDYYVEGVGSAITLTPVENLTTVGDFYNNLDDEVGKPQVPDYLTVKRDSLDQNAWTRSNRWFHSDVINQTAKYNKTVPEFNNSNRAKRPIIEFDSNLRLFNFGTLAVKPIDVIDFKTTDALSFVHGSKGYFVDGYKLVNGSRVVFANDQDPRVKNKVYIVTLIDPDGEESDYGTIINLVEDTETEILEDMVLTCNSGTTLVGQQYRYTDQGQWLLCQEKTGINQAPLFDVFDNNGKSFGDIDQYPSTTFAGSKLFSYKQGTTVQPDQYLGFSLSYENIDNIGDIVFESNIDTDTFLYVENFNSQTMPVNTGYTRTYSSRTDYSSSRGWVKTADNSHQRQVFTFQYSGAPLVLDVSARSDLTVPNVKVYVENSFVAHNTYDVVVTGTSTEVRFNSNSTVVDGNIVQVKVLADQASSAAYYEVPKSLQSNPFNEVKGTYTLGNVRSHYNSLVEDVVTFKGEVNGSNNTRDIGYLSTYGNTIIQNSASLAAAGFFMRNNHLSLFEAITAAARDYEKVKSQILNWAITNDTYGMTPAEALDLALIATNVGKTSTSKYYWGDMVPFGGDYIENANTVSVISTRVYETKHVYDFTTAGSNGILVYHNDVLLVKDKDYVVATDGPRIELQFDAELGDTIVIREYATTYGSFIPSTPTKLGLYPSKVPEIYTDETFIQPKTVIQGHDGSITVGFDDVRDEILLEFERRIFNNLKLDNNPLPIEPEDVVSGEFRKADYSLNEVNSILSVSFLEWAGWNKIDYKKQDYRAGNEWTYNYSTSTCKLDGSLLPGHWRGIYNRYYDTDHPHLHPWEMLGYTIQPDWWEDKYGPAPYTSGNLVLWQDLEAGYDRNSDTYDSRFARPGLTKVIPVDSEGNLVSPMQSLVANYNSLDFRKSWNFGDGSPAETAWRRSSSFAFAMQRMYALTKPAKYFGLMVDRDLYKLNSALGQYVYNERFGYDFRKTNIADVNNPKHSYINWLVEAYRNNGIETMEALTDSISNSDVRLMYRTGGFTDKKYLRIFTDKSSPDSSNRSLILPDESYSILLYKNQPTVDVRYSGVIVQVVDGGYAVYGHSTAEPYFRIQQTKDDNNAIKFEFDDTAYYLPKSFTDVVVRVPYGTTFTTKAALLDFLVAYGEFLKRQGVVFEDRDNNYTLDWGLMCNEFLNWAGQGWDAGSVINLNPSANNLKYNRRLTVIDDITQNYYNDYPIDSNGTVLTPKDYKVTRIGNSFNFASLNGKSLSYLRMRGVSFEHLIVLDNTSIFNDLVFDRITGLRQHRIRVDGYKTANWDGQLNARGFIVNQDNVSEWKPNTVYNKHDLVSFKNSYWTATKKLQPKSEFDIGDWEKIESSMIPTGMLANPANRAEQIRDYYNNQTTNLESDADLLGLGLTGFRSREYLSALNLNDTSQVQLYSQLVENKGTVPMAERFNNVNLERLESNYKIRENWAIKRATYGANSNKRYVELALDESKLRSNPSTVGIGAGTKPTPGPLQPYTADQHIDVNDIHRQAVKNVDKNIFPLLDGPIVDASLPTAGYVNAEDVDLQLFSMDDLHIIDANLDKIKERATVWVARKNQFDWDIFRCSSIEATQVTLVNNLDGTAELQFDKAHTITRGQIFVVKNTQGGLDGAHRAIKIDDYKTITIKIDLPKDVTVLEGLTGIVFKLDSARVNKPSATADLDYVNSVYPGDKVWADKNASNKWSVYEKQLPFSVVQNVSQSPENEGYGAAVAQTKHNMLVGAPQAGSTGGLYVYSKDRNRYKFLTLLDNLSGAGEMGYSIASKHSWTVAGAPSNEGCVAVINDTRSGPTMYQCLIHPAASRGVIDSRLGHSVAMSDDENWIYASAIGTGEVHSYRKILLEEQTARFVSDGSYPYYDLTGKISVSDKKHLKVTVGEDELDVTQYNLTSNVLTINDSPSAGLEINVERISTVTQEGNGSQVVFDGVGKIYTAQDLESFAVYVDNVLQRPFYDYSFNYSSGEITFNTAPRDKASVVFRSSDYFKYTNTIQNTADSGFGYAINTTVDGQQIYIGANTATVDGVEESGKLFVYERVVERLPVTDVDAREYQTRRTLEPNTIVMLNSKRLTNGLHSVSSESYTVDTVRNLIVLSDEIETVIGDNIDIGTNEYNLVQEILIDHNHQDARFGSSVDVCTTECSLYIGAPFDSRTTVQAGSVTRYVNRARLFGTIQGKVADPVLMPADSIRINNIEVTITGTSVYEAADDINASIIPNVHAHVDDGKLTIELVNPDQAPVRNKLAVMPGRGTAFLDLGFMPFVLTQVIQAPTEYETANFGSSVFIDQTSSQLIVGARRGTTQLPVTLDNDNTILDSSATSILDEIDQSGAVYTFDLLPSDSANDTGRFVFGQQIYDSNVDSNDRFGTAVDYTDNTLVVTSPEFGPSNTGRAAVFNNPTRGPAWKMIREQVEVVDVRKIYRCYLFNKQTQDIDTRLDFIDPANGKLLGVVDENLNFKTPTDPAVYSRGTGVVWGASRVGQMWWDMSQSRFLDCNQNDINYASRVWGSVVPGSSVDVYEWIESNVPPKDYEQSNPGTVYDVNLYSEVASVSATKTITVAYYFWAKTPSVNRQAGKSLSADTVAAYIANPQASGIPYIALMRRNLVGLVNCQDLLHTESVIHIEFNQTLVDNNVFVEYDLVQAGEPTAFVNSQVWRKMKDSLCGSDTLGNLVPDFHLSTLDKYGVSYRPRQSMFVDRFAALSEIIQNANNILDRQPFTELKTFGLLSAEELEPLMNTGAWDKKVADLSELAYQAPAVDGVGYKYLVEADGNHNGLWTIYTVQPNFTLLLSRVQSYDTKRFWSYKDWFAEGYSNLIKPAKVVKTYSELLALTETSGTVAKVTSNSDNKWELYQLDNGVWNRIALESGTIQISNSLWDYSISNNGFDREVFDAQYFDQEPIAELRNVLESLMFEILTGDFVEYRNQLLSNVFKYILSEQGKVDWLFKTSLIDVSSKVRDLDQYEVYQKDNQDFVLSHINETKPYHVKVKDFASRYEGIDHLTGNVYDYDVPSSYDANYKQFISPVLDDGIAILETDNSNRKDYVDETTFQAASNVWQTRPWADWYDNHKLSISSVVVTHPGNGYTIPPQVEFHGVCDKAAKGIAVINELGEVTEVVITDPGQGYRTIPTITVSGGNGSGAVAVVYTKHDLVRSLKTSMRYDRYDYSYSPEQWIEPVYNELDEMIKSSPAYPPGYRVMYNGTQYICHNVNENGHLVSSTPNEFIESEWQFVNVIVDWQPETVYKTGQLVRSNDRVYRAVNADGVTASDLTFDPLEYELVAADTLSGIDRTTGFYVADVNNPGLDLALLVNGLDYPMIQLTAPSFSYNTGYDVGLFDQTVFDNIEVDPSGNPTYSEAILDNEIFTSFTGTYTGVDLSGIDAVQATALASVANLEVTGIVPIELGKGYSADVPPTLTIAAPQENLGASADALSDGDQITSITPTSGGFGYLTPPTVTIREQEPTPGVQATATATITAGQVTGYSIAQAGSGYTVPPLVTFSDPLSVQTARATADVLLLNSTGGVAAVSVDNNGNSYTSAPAITVSAPPPSVTATGTVSLDADNYALEPNGVVTTFGNYYSVAPAAYASAPTALSAQASASAVISNGEVSSISIDTVGRMYRTPPTVTVQSTPNTPGVPASAIAVLDPDISGFDSDDGFDYTGLETEGGITSITMFNPGSGYTTTPVVTVSEPDIVGGIRATAIAIISGDIAPLAEGQGYIERIEVIESGTGYTSSPVISITLPNETISHGQGATATAVLDDTGVIAINVDNPGYGYDETPTIVISAPTEPYAATVETTAVAGKVSTITVTEPGWGYETTPTLTIADPDVTPTVAQLSAQLTGDEVTSVTVVDPGAGYLTEPTLIIDTDPSVAANIATGTAVLTDDTVSGIIITNPGATYLDEPTITLSGPDGLTYHGSGATATATISSNQVVSFTITNPGSGYDIAPDVIITGPTRNTRQATAEPVVIGNQITSYVVTDPGYGYLSPPAVFIGTPSDVDPDADIVGGEFVDVYNSHAPEELVPGAIFDTLDMRVYTRSGFDYGVNGHGSEIKTVVRKYRGSTTPIVWGHLVSYPAALVVFNMTRGTRLYETDSYTVDWVNKTISVTGNATLLDEIKVFVYGIGGDNHLFTHSTIGSLVTDSTVVIPVNVNDVDDMLVMIDGTPIDGYQYEAGAFESETNVVFDTEPDADSYILIQAFAENPNEDSGSFSDLSYSLPVVEKSNTRVTQLVEADLRHAGRENLIVERNGLRLRPPAGRRHIADGLETTFALVDGDRTGIDLTQIASDEVSVYVNTIESTDWTLDPAASEAEGSITFTTAPESGASVDVYVKTYIGQLIDGIQQPAIAQYFLDTTTDEISIDPAITIASTDTVAVTSFGDSREQGMLTEVFVGPVTISVADRERFDQYNFDVDAWDREIGVTKVLNIFDITSGSVKTDRMWVTLNGKRLAPALDYSLDAQGSLAILGRSLNSTDVVVVTSFTDSVVPQELNFRIFKDMRNNTGIYRIRNSVGSTRLTQPLAWYDETIHVEDASLLAEPNLTSATFGIVLVNGERITYRERDLNNNTLSGLRRSTGGTGLPALHPVESILTDAGAGEILKADYDEVWYNTVDPWTLVEGASVVGLYNWDPYRRANNGGEYYEVGDRVIFNNEVYEYNGDTQNGTALQQQLTTAARFFRGE